MFFFGSTSDEGYKESQENTYNKGKEGKLKSYPEAFEDGLPSAVLNENTVKIGLK